MACYLPSQFQLLAYFALGVVTICALTWVFCRILYPNPIEFEGDDEPLGETSAYRREAK